MKRSSLATVLTVPAGGTTDAPARTRLKSLAALWRDRGGATPLEYALLVGFVAVPLALGAPALGAAVQGLLDPSSRLLQPATASCEASRIALDRAARPPGQP